MSMDQRQRRREGSQRAQAARTARQETRRQRERRSRLYAMAGVLAAVVVAAAAAIVLLRDTGPTVGFAVRELPARHGPPYFYETSLTIDDVRVEIPPTSGSHTDASPEGFLGRPLIAESVVHNMEHGSVVVWYQPGDPDLAGDVNQLVRDLGQTCIVGGSFAQMSFEVAATAWGLVLPLAQFDREALAEFIREHRAKRGPEAGVCRG